MLLKSSIWPKTHSFPVRPGVPAARQAGTLLLEGTVLVGGAPLFKRNCVLKQPFSSRTTNDSPYLDHYISLFLTILLSGVFFRQLSPSSFPGTFFEAFGGPSCAFWRYRARALYVTPRTTHPSNRSRPRRRAQDPQCHHRQAPPRSSSGAPCRRRHRLGPLRAQKTTSRPYFMAPATTLRASRFTTAWSSTSPSLRAST